MNTDDQTFSGFGQLPSSSDRRDTSSIIERIDPSIVTEKILREFAGQTYDGTTGKFVRDPTLTPIINEKGLGTVRVMFDSIINSNTTFSNLSEKEVMAIIKGFANEVVNTLTINKNSYGIKKPSDAMTISLAVANNALFCLRRGFKAGEKKFLNTSFSSHETVTQVDRGSDKKRFGLGGIKF